MIQSEFKHEKLSPGKGLLQVLLLLLVVAALSLLCGYVGFLLKTNVGSYVAIAIVILGLTLFMKRNMQNYCYTMGAKRMRVERYMGGNRKNLLEFPLDDMVWLGEWKHRPPEYQSLHFQKLTFCKKESAQAMVYQDRAKNGKLYGFCFSPSQEMMDALLQRQGGLQNEKPDDNGNG